MVLHRLLSVNGDDECLENADAYAAVRRDHANGCVVWRHPRRKGGRAGDAHRGYAGGGVPAVHGSARGYGAR